MPEKLRDDLERLECNIKAVVVSVESFDRRLKALEHIAFGDGKPKKKVGK